MNICTKILFTGMCVGIGMGVTGFGGAKTVADARVTLEPEFGQPVVMAGQENKAFLKVAITGFSLPAAQSRAPVNLAIVLDKSGSMNGGKIQEAKRAAIMAVNRLNDQDIVSIVTYDSTVRVVVPATKVSDKRAIVAAIQRISAAGNTALFAGVAKGAGELAKFLSEEKVNRVILLSDGLANRGPSSPGELGELGASLVKDGISVTTLGLGLGYNEDLMTQLAMASDGNHAFVENASELVAIFDREFADVLSVVAQDVSVQIRCEEGITPVRVLGRDAQIYNNTINVRMNQLYANQTKYVLLEVALPAYAVGRIDKAAKVKVSYSNLITHEADHLTSLVPIQVTKSSKEVEQYTNKKVMEEAVALLANEENKRAVVLRDAGQVAEAKKVLKRNAAYLKQNAGKYGSKKLESLSDTEEQSAEAVDKESWNRTRKALREQQYKTDTQQAW